MCGIVGFISTKDKSYSSEKRHFMKYALMLDTLRGEDSTGMFTINNKQKVKVRHTMQPGDRWVAGKAFKDTPLDVCVAVGHNRAATKGKISLDNTHPFTFGDVTLVHNGTLLDFGYSLNDYDTNLEVDSKQIALSLSKKPPEESYKVLEKINGSFALVWYDSRDKSINLTKNTDRPLHLCWNKQKDIMWFMSDGHHLYAVNKSLKRTTGAGEEIVSLSNYTHVKFFVGENIKPKTRKYSRYIAPVFSRNHQHKNYNEEPFKDAAKKWNEAVYTQKNSDTNLSNVRVTVNDKKRSVPLPQVRSLKQIYDLSIYDFLEFRPKELIDTCAGRRKIAVGEIIHRDWDNTEWPAIIYDVPKIQANAYKRQSWLVHPVGIGVPVDDMCTILSELVHCKWKEWEKKHLTKNTETKTSREQEIEEPQSHLDLMIPGPDGRFVRKGDLEKLCEAGCIQCSIAIEDDEAEGATFVNEGRDLLCATCIVETEYGWQEHMARQAKLLH